MDLSRLQQTGPDTCKSKFSYELAVHVYGFVVHAIVEEDEEAHGDGRPAIILEARLLESGEVNDWLPGLGSMNS